MAPRTGVYRGGVNTVVEVIDCSALVLPLVGGRNHQEPSWVPDTIERLRRELANPKTRELGFTVIAEWAGIESGTAAPVITDVATYLDASYSGIYGALGMQAPHGLPTGPAVLVPESLGHAVIRYLVGQSMGTNIDHRTIPVALVEVSRPLSDQERQGLLQNATSRHLVLIATHAASGILANGMSQGRKDVQREIDQIILGTLNGC